MKKDEFYQVIKGPEIPDIIVDLLSSLSAIKELSELHSYSGNEKELINKALSVLIQNQDMERCSFFVPDGDNNLVNLTGLSIKEYLGEKKTNAATLTFKMGEGMIGLAAKSGILQHSNDCSVDLRFANINAQTSEMLPGSIICAPVLAANKLVGVLNISHPDKNYFSEWHIRLLHIYKNMMGELISNHRLLLQMETQVVARTQKLEAALEAIKHLKEHYQSISMLDELTGLYNRRYFYDQIEAVLARTIRQAQPLSVAIFDIDHFKKINDVYGHALGDTVLRDVSRSVKEEIRESDIFVRFGGEEFVILFIDSDSDKGFLFAERIRNKIASLSWKSKENQVKITTSIGIYCLQADALNHNNADIDSLIAYADQALYTAKATGRNKTVLFREENSKK